MKAFKLTTVAALMAATSMPTLADNTDITQIVKNLQDALNEIHVVHNNTNVTQTAVNAANLITLKENLDDVLQFTSADQNANNLVTSLYGQWNDLTQEATNVANSITLEGTINADINDVSQIVSPYADQWARNTADYGQWIDGLEQSATNALNMLTVDDINVIAKQSVSFGTFQDAFNYVEGGAGVAYVYDAVQNATNVANMITAVDASRINQYAAHAQNAANSIEFGNREGAADLMDAAQNATNVANMATLADLTHSIDQTKYGSQSARNVTNYVSTSASEAAYLRGTVSNLDQIATNVANMISIEDTLPSLNNVIEVDQVFDASQVSSNVLYGNGAVNDAVQNATNVANSISNPE